MTLLLSLATLATSIELFEAPFTVGILTGTPLAKSRTRSILWLAIVTLPWEGVNQWLLKARTKYGENVTITSEQQSCPGPSVMCVLVEEEARGGVIGQTGNDTVPSNPYLVCSIVVISMSCLTLVVHPSIRCRLSLERRIEIAAVNDPPRVHLPGQVFQRSLSVVWPDIEEFEVALTNPLVVDEDALLDVPSVAISGKSRLIECTDLAGVHARPVSLI